MGSFRTKSAASLLATMILGLDDVEAEKIMEKAGLTSAEASEIIVAHTCMSHGVMSGSVLSITGTIISTLETTERIDPEVTVKEFEEHCICKKLDANGKCIAFCFHNRLKSPGVMVDCIGIESSEIEEYGHIAFERKL